MRLGKLAKRMRARADEHHPVRAWLAQNYRQIAAALVVAGSKKGPPWTALAAAAAEAGIVTKAGNPPSAQGLQDAWTRLEAKRLADEAVLAAKFPPWRKAGRVSPPVASSRPAALPPFQPAVSTKPKYHFPKISRMKPMKEP